MLGRRNNTTDFWSSARLSSRFPNSYRSHLPDLGAPLRKSYHPLHPSSISRLGSFLSFGEQRRRRRGRLLGRTTARRRTTKRACNHHPPQLPSCNPHLGLHASPTLGRLSCRLEMVRSTSSPPLRLAFVRTLTFLLLLLSSCLLAGPRSRSSLRSGPPSSFSMGTRTTEGEELEEEGWVWEE